MARTLNDVRRADEMQRQAAERQRAEAQALEDQINAIPGLSDHKRAFLREFPLLLLPDNAAILTRHYRRALADGVEDDSTAMDEAIISGFQADMRAGQDGLRQDPTSTNVEVAPEPTGGNPPVEPDIIDQVDELLADVGRLRNTSFAATPMAMATGLPPVAIPPAHGRTLPVSAPVSREIPTPSGRKNSDSRNVTLNSEERDMAHRSYHWLSKPEAEFEYAKQKQRLLRQRADGSYSG